MSSNEQSPQKKTGSGRGPTGTGGCLIIPIIGLLALLTLLVLVFIPAAINEDEVDKDAFLKEFKIAAPESVTDRSAIKPKIDARMAELRADIDAVAKKVAAEQKAADGLPGNTPDEMDKRRRAFEELGKHQEALERMKFNACQVAKNARKAGFDDINKKFGFEGN